MVGVGQGGVAADGAIEVLERLPRAPLGDMEAAQVVNCGIEGDGRVAVCECSGGVAQFGPRLRSVGVGEAS